MTDTTETTAAPPAQTDAPTTGGTPAPAPVPALEAKADAGTEGAPAPAPTPSVPEKYDFALPDGIALDELAATEFSALAKELGMSQEKAQAVADIGVQMMSRLQQAQAAARDAQVAEWVQAAQTDAEFGGVKFDESVAIANRALDEFGGAELKEALKATGMGNHPELIRAFYRVGLKISDDAVHRSGAGGSAAPLSIAQQMYPGMNP